ncbi:hypothetical protein E2562_007095 [Oryza meyeriana var. granulata]|uniref:Uncharacterized protein n=1 Tax=Oryza meyeriana var. granulata TaxID=110450 RepID=A0A6G1F4W0_9ORYZ|nr:hypothetical protein E2562_007095 [Oryza meyeriana var. granulata]
MVDKLDADLSLGSLVTCIPCSDNRHNLNLPEEVQTARLLGSYDIGWLFVSLDHVSSHYLYHVGGGTPRWLSLSDEMEMDEPLYDPDSTFNVSMQVVTLLASSSTAGCVGAALVSRHLHYGTVRDVMFWSIGDVTGWGSMHQSRSLDVVREEAVDMVYH